MQHFELLRWIWSERMGIVSLVWWLRRQPHLAQVTSLSLFGRSVVFLSAYMQPHLWWPCTCIVHISTSTTCSGLGVIPTVSTCRLWCSKRRGQPFIVTRSSNAYNSTWLRLNFKTFVLFPVEFYFLRSIYSALIQNPRTIRSRTSIHTSIIFWTCLHILEMVHISIHIIMPSWRVSSLSTSASQLAATLDRCVILQRQLLLTLCVYRRSQ